MYPELGHFSLVIALVLAIFTGVLPLIGAQTKHAGLMAVGRSGAVGLFVFVALSFACLTMAFIENDFTVKYVAGHSNSLLPVWYRVSAVWGGHEGSLLLWVFCLVGWTAAVAMFSKSLPEETIARVLGVMGLIAIGFISFTLFTSNPFERLLPGFPADGNDLNPLLQDPGLIFHPPMLYMGYVGFSVAFAFAIAGLISGRLDSAWARWSRPWTTVAWCFLTLGIALGSWWAYYELGWGGWWFWDPVENASFMPWLSGTALMHSLAVSEKRGLFRSWTVLLALITFSLSLLGTFLVRSGVLTSVHAFASDPTRGLFILVFLLFVVGGSLTLFALRAGTLTPDARHDLVSRESGLLVNNVLLIAATFVVLLGTLFPLFSDVAGLGKVSVGPPYFNMLFAPLFLIILLFMAPGSVVRWKRHESNALGKFLLQPAVAALVLGVASYWLVAGEVFSAAVIAMAAAWWVTLVTLKDLWIKSASKKGRVAGFAKLSRSYWGMVLGHLGIAVTVVGAVLTTQLSVEKDVRVVVNTEVEIGEYSFLLKKIHQVQGPNYVATQGVFDVIKDDKVIDTLTPEKRQYFAQPNNPMTEAAIDPSLMRDLYVALGEPIGDGAWAARVYLKPFVRWIWLGCIIMALGGFMAITDRRYRLRKKAKAKQDNESMEVATDGSQA